MKGIGEKRVSLWKFTNLLKDIYFDIASDTEPTGSPVKAAIEATASSSLAPAGTATGEESRIKKLERLIKQGFDR